MNELRKHIEELISLSDAEFLSVSSYFTMKQYKKDEFLIRQQEKVPYTYFVVSGLLKLIYTDASGKEYILSFAMEDWWETDYLAFNTGTKATMSLKCLENTKVLCLTLKDYQALCAAFPKMEHFFLQKAVNGHIASQQRILSLLSSNAADRYAKLLKRYPSLLQRVSKSQLAAYLGVSRETLSRLYQ